MLTDIAEKGQSLRQEYRKFRRRWSARAIGLILALGLTAQAAAQDGPGGGDDRLARQVAAFAEAYDRGQYDQAAELGAVALAMSRQAFGDDAQQTGFLMLNLARVYLRMGEHDDAAQLFGEARMLFARADGPSHPAVLDAELGLAATSEVDDPETAAGRYGDVVMRMRALADVDPVMLANAEVGLARALRQTGDTEAALAAYATAVDRFAESLGPYHPATVQTRAAWATLQPSRWIGADTLAESWRTLRATLGDAHPETVRVGLVAARMLLNLGLARATLDIAMPLAARGDPAGRAEAALLLDEAWKALRDPAAAVRAVRVASPPEGAEPRVKEVAAAYLATTLIGFDRAVEAALAIDRARRLTGSLGTAGAQLAESLVRMAEPGLAAAASLGAADLLAEAAAIVQRLDPAHPRRGELEGLIALRRAHQALADGDPDQARAIARQAVDALTGADDPRGLLRLQLRTAQAAAFVASGSDRLAAIAYNGLERDVATAAKTAAQMAETDGALLLTPDEAVAVLRACADYWRSQQSTERLTGIQAAIAHWQVTVPYWPAASAADPGAD